MAIPPATAGNPWHRHPDKHLGLVIPTSVLAACRQWPGVKPLGQQPPACRSCSAPEQHQQPRRAARQLACGAASQLVSAGTQSWFGGTNLQPAGACSAPPPPPNNTPSSHPSGSGAVAKMHAASPPPSTHSLQWPKPAFLPECGVNS